jgi:hypothetical protein
MRNAEKKLAGGDPYGCKRCGAILNKHSTVTWHQAQVESRVKLELGPH